LQAGAYFLFVNQHGKKVYVEFVLGKVLGYWAYTSKDQALVSFEMISTHIASFPSLHMPSTPVDENQYF